MGFRRQTLKKIALLSGVLGTSCFLTQAACAQPENHSELNQKIKRLVEQLGDPNYSRREQAKSELERIGYVSLDQLHAASFHPDPQIAATARFMVNSNQFVWTGEYDTPRVREILNNFSVAEVEGRAVYIDELARLEREEGIPGLCRLARYEPQGNHAKRAALHVLQSKPRLGIPLSVRNTRILAMLEGGESVTCRWIIKHLTTEGPIDLKWWKEQIENEQKLLDSRSPDTSPSIVSQLTKWVVENASKVPELRSEAVALATFLLDQPDRGPSTPLADKASKSLDLAQWALGLGLYEIVRAQHTRLPFRSLQRESLLTYYLAESFLQEGRKDLAEKIANLALECKPVNVDGSEMMPPQANDDPLRSTLESNFGYRNLSSKEKRLTIGERLADRGLFEWAERELRIGASDDMTIATTLRSMQRLAEIQHSREQYEAAKETLGAFVRRYNNEKMFQDQMRDYPSFSAVILSHYHQYAGDADRVRGENASAISNYNLAIKFDSDNVDALIGLYKVDGDEKHQTERRALLKEVTNELRGRIRDLDDTLKHANNFQYADVARFLANYLNSLAWVIANTEGNPEEAVLLSRRAIMLNPDEAALLDTLAHCYFAAGKWDDAVEQQRKAVELKPYQPDLLRAMARFEERRAQEETQKSRNRDSSNSP